MVSGVDEVSPELVVCSPEVAVKIDAFTHLYRNSQFNAFSSTFVDVILLLDIIVNYHSCVSLLRSNLEVRGLVLFKHSLFIAAKLLTSAMQW